MDLFQSCVLGVVQGLTEYLPISSSAHLVIVPHLMGWNISESHAFIFDVLVQLGTLVGVVWYFWNDLWSIAKQVLSGIYRKDPFSHPDARLGWLVVMATIPAAAIGLIFKDQVAAYFSSPKAASGFLVITAALLIASELVGRMLRDRVGTKDAVAMGFAQAFALLPGVSRSGSTIAVGMLNGLNRTSAAKFSFLMSIPVMVGASLVAAKGLTDAPDVLAEMFTPILIGFTSAAISGYFVIRWFLHFLKTSSLFVFAAYCAIVGVAGLVYF